MNSIISVANYIIEKYKAVSGSNVIDEMKLHKLLYFAQRESLAITDNPLFPEPLEGWKYGPVSPLVRSVFTPHGLEVDDYEEVSPETMYIVNNVIDQYGSIEAWKLSELSHREISWNNAREGLNPSMSGNRELSIDDIRLDAEKIRPYDSLYDMYYDEFENAEVIVQ